MLWLALLAGLLIGVVSGIVGIGGGVLLVPVLVYFFHMSQHRAQGTSLAALLLPVGGLALWQYYRAGNADVKVGLVVAVGFFVGGYFGGALAQHVSEAVLRKTFAVVLVAVGVKMFLQKG
jgi:hypothetical protein